MDGFNLRLWHCGTCKHEILSSREPSLIKWLGGHVCKNWYEIHCPLHAVMKRLEDGLKKKRIVRDQRGHNLGIFLRD